MKAKYNYRLIKSPRLRGAIVENILLSLLLHPLQEMSVSDLISDIKRRLPLISSKAIKKYFVYLVDYQLISYSGKTHSYKIEKSGLDLLFFIKKEKERLTISDSNDLTITIEERGD